MKQFLFMIITLLFVSGCYMNDNTSEEKETKPTSQIEKIPEPQQNNKNTQGTSSAKYGSIPPAPPVLN